MPRVELSAALVFVMAGVTAAWWYSRRKDGPPRSWKKVGVIKQVILYPLKSGKGLLMDSAQATSFGLKHPQHVISDRCLVLYKEDSGGWLTAREQPQLVLVTVDPLDDNRVKLSMPGTESLIIQLPAQSPPSSATIKLWYDEKVRGVDVGEGVRDWLSSSLEGSEGVRLSLAYWPASAPRRTIINKNYPKIYPSFQNNDTGAFSDLGSFLLLCESTVDDLNTRLPAGTKVSPSNFRPNLLIEGLPPYSEDDLTWVRVGEHTIFRFTKPCTRCKLTTINPETGIKDPNLEPIATLKKYRQLKNPKLREVEGGSPVIGAYMGLRSSPGTTISVGDPVYIPA